MTKLQKNEIKQVNVVPQKENSQNITSKKIINTVPSQKRIVNTSNYLQKSVIGDLTISNDTYLQGGVTGNITVKSGKKLVIQSRVKGDITLEKNAELIIESSLIGNIYNNGGIIKNLGNLQGRIIQ